MSPLDDALADYLTIRRALGYKLERAGKLLPQYLDYLDGLGDQLVTIENALAWATLPAGDANWWAFRMSVVRGFASYLHALDPVHELPPKDLLPRTMRRMTPYLYSDQEIQVLMAAASSLQSPLRQATYRTLIGLLSVTGMRIGEAIRLDNNDVDLAMAC
jgi:integrase